jgi:hypothetical protein
MQKGETSRRVVVVAASTLDIADEVELLWKHEACK